MTLPALRHDVQTLSRFGVPFTIARTRWMFGFQRRLVRRCEWLSRMPNCGFLAQTSQTEDMMTCTSRENASGPGRNLRPQGPESQRSVAAR